MRGFTESTVDLLSEFIRLCHTDEKNKMVFVERLDAIVVSPKEREFAIEVFTECLQTLAKSKKIKRGTENHLNNINTNEFGIKLGTIYDGICIKIQQGKFSAEQIAEMMQTTPSVVKRCITKLKKKKGVLISYTQQGTISGRIR